MKRIHRGEHPPIRDYGPDPFIFNIDHATNMNSLELTDAITAVTNALSCRLTSDEIALLSTIFVQFGDTLSTIAAVKSSLKPNHSLKKSFNGLTPLLLKKHTVLRQF